MFVPPPPVPTLTAGRLTLSCKEGSLYNTDDSALRKGAKSSIVISITNTPPNNLFFILILYGFFYYCYSIYYRSSKPNRVYKPFGSCLNKELKIRIIKIKNCIGESHSPGVD